MHLAKLRQERKSAVALLFAISAIPIVGLVGLAIDYGIWNQTYASISLAASSAALNAVKVANAAYMNNDSSPVTEGQNAGKQWFISQVGTSDNATHFSTIHTNQVSVKVTVGATTMATVTFSDLVPSIFGNLFGIAQYPLNVTAQSEIVSDPYLEVVLMLDNSSSMDLAATPSGMAQLAEYSPCDPSNAFYITGGTALKPTYTSASGDSYNNYQCTYGGYSYNSTFAAGLPTCDVTAQPGLYSANPTMWTQNTATNVYPTQTYAGGTDVPPTNLTCQGVLAKTTTSLATTPTVIPPVTYYPQPGPPCTFACHWTTALSSDGKTTNDMFGLARRQGIQLRFDLVKNATNKVLTQMASDNIATLNNLTVGIYTFNSTVTQIYPNPTTCGVPGSSTCEAGSDFTTAMSYVGTPPQAPAVTDSGYLPAVGGVFGDNDDTAFPEDMNALYNTYVTKAGSGATAAAPRKVLFLITDGFEDDPNIAYPNDRLAFESKYCTQFKNAGYQVYVVDTPYYPVEHVAYLSNDWAKLVEQTGTQSITYQLQACSSNTTTNGSYYFTATDGNSLNAALLAALKSAEQSPARFTQ
jgi:Flp pilus assembly protein TadG